MFFADLVFSIASRQMLG